jgi:adenylate kinase
MRMILNGPPASGKGTQAKLLKERLNLAHIATGDILREAVRLGTPAGKKAEPFMKSGQLAPDELVNELVADRFRRDDRPTSFVLDGYPRTLPQAVALDEVLREVDLPLDAVVFLAVADEVLIPRATGRWICPKDQTPYHTLNNPPKTPGKCDQCGSVLVQRPDDREETVRERLKRYGAQTMELIPYYRAQGLLHEVPGTGDVETISSAIVKAIS